MKKFLSIILAAFMCLSVVCCFGQEKTYADCAGAPTSIIDCDDGEDGVKHILYRTIDILSVVVGIVGVLGIVIVGIQYLTAGDKEEQVRKAKRRLFEIIIGIVAYVLIYAFLRFLLPNFEQPTSLQPRNTNHTVAIIASTDN